MIKKNCLRLGLLVLIFGSVVVFQNCGNKSSFKAISSTEGDITDPVFTNFAKCEYDGKEYLNTQSVETFVESSVAFDKECVKQTHICNDGIWSGTIGFKTCEKGVARSCLLGTETIAHNTSVTRYASSTVPYNQSCRSQERKCFDGTIDGNYEAIGCEPEEPPRALNDFECKMRAGQDNQKIEDLYQKWSDGSSRKVATCSNWQLTGRDRVSWNCGRFQDGIYGSSAARAREPSCCPENYTVVNGVCSRISQRFQPCYGPLHCANGLECKDDRVNPSPDGRTCQ